MKAVLLSAGLGKRLAPLTDELPKVLIPVNGKPCLEHNIENLRNYGINSFLVNTHCFSNKIRDYFGDGSRLKCQIEYSHESALLGTAGALNSFRDSLNSTFLVAYGDVISDINIEKVLEVHRRNLAEITIVLDKKRGYRGKGIVLTEGERVKYFIEKPPHNIEGALINSGLYILEPSILRGLPEGFSDFGRDILPDLTLEGKVFCSEHEGYIFDIGTLEDLRRTEDFLRER